MKTCGVGCRMTKSVNERAQSPWKKWNEKGLAPSNMPNEAEGNTSVNLYELSKQTRRAERVIDSESDMRLEKVRAIREEIQRGAYTIQYDRIAENMLDVFVDEMSADPPAVLSETLFLGYLSLLS
jgi:flagellar biosynthesis anti-sigma factor FlgM